MGTQATVTIQITREDGVFIGDCVELGISTHAATVEELRAAVADMLQGYFLAARKTGLFAREATKIGLPIDATEFALAVRFTGPDDHVVIDLHHAA
ncbi:MAG: hypothetical protein EXR72_13925 [Myxococcales bacterium]|nr:hypothetical protein [Myxococcales bacterium]